MEKIWNCAFLKTNKAGCLAGKSLAKAFILACLFLYCSETKAQPRSDSAAWQRATWIEGAFEWMTTDPLQQIYALDAHNELFKYSADGVLLFQYNNNRLGRLAWVDAVNPFNVLLYYPDFQIVKILDRTLNPSGEFKLYELGMANPAALALSNDNHLWVFDEVNAQLKKIGREGQILAQSDNLALLLGQRPQPIQAQANGNFVFVNDPGLGILVFDAFGQYDHLIPIKNILNFQHLDGFLWYQTTQGVFWCDNMGRGITRLQLPDTGNAFRLEKNNWFILKKSGVEVWKKKQ